MLRRFALEVLAVHEHAFGGTTFERKLAVPEPFLTGGRVHYALGYTGNGVGPSHLMGKVLAAKATHAEIPELHLPVVDMEPRRFPPQPFRSIGAAIVNAATVRRDDALDTTGRVDPVTDLLARMPRRTGYHLGP